MPYNKQKFVYRECGGSQICPQNNYKYYCIKCIKCESQKFVFNSCFNRKPVELLEDRTDKRKYSCKECKLNE